MIAIIGAGISGISAGYHLNEMGKENIIFEKNKTWGGLCDNFTIGNGFRFDYFVHLSFSNSEYVNSLFRESSDYIAHKPLSSNYSKGYWLKHPAQNNLAPLPTIEKIKIISDFINKPSIKRQRNYHEWLVSQFGEYFTKEYSDIYTKKYWAIDSTELTTDWVNNRFSIPSLEKLLKGAFEDQETNFYYAPEMRYPRTGGYKSFLNKMAGKCNIASNKEVKLIDVKNKTISFGDNTVVSYAQLISSMPLPELINCIKDVPQKIKEASSSLQATSGQLVSFGFNRPDIQKNLWFYIYDDDILPSRAYSPSLKSPDNVPSNKHSLQFETYSSIFSPPKMTGDNLVEHIIDKGKKMNLWMENDIEVIDYREVKYANVIFDHNRKKSLKTVHNYLDKIGILYIGRFGDWGYYWSDQSLLSGKNVISKLI